MLNKFNFGLILFFVSFFLLFRIVGASTYDLATDTNWNIRIDGEQASDKLGRYNISYGDLDNDGKDDLILSVKSTIGYEDRDNINIIYIISNSLLSDLSSFGNTIDLANPANYSLKIVSANSGDYSDYYVATASDLNNNGEKDLILGEGYASHGGVSSRGAVYVIYDSILSQYSGQTGQVLDLLDPDNFNLKFLGTAEGDFLGYSYNASLDLNGDGKKDLILNADNASFTNGPQSGSLYIIYNDLLSTFDGVGTVIDLSDSNNFNIRVDGPISYGWTESYVVGENSDVNSDGINDLILYVPLADNNSAPYSGSMYAIYSTILDTYVGTGNILDLADPTKFNLRIDGIKDNSASPGPSFGYSVTQVVDLDDNGDNDLLIADGYADENNRSTSGSAFIIFDSILQSHLGLGQVLDLTSSTDYNIRYDGAITESYLGEDIHTMDIDNDGKLDVLVDAAGASAVYILKNSTVTADVVSTGQIFDFADSSSYDDLYTSSTGYLSSPYSLVDLDGDDSADFVFSDPYTDYNSKSNSGSVYIIYNFPHEFSLTSTDTSDGFILQGVVSSESSVADITNVEYQLDSNDIFGTWTACTPDDGDFDSLSEDFTCSVSSELLNDGNHTLYVRAIDAKSSFTVLANYFSNAFTIVPAPVHHIVSSGSVSKKFTAQHSVIPEIPIVPDKEVIDDITILSKTLKVNMTDDEVKILQHYLNTHGFVLATTGAGSLGFETTKFGSLTKKAVIKFQLANHLTPDGIVGPKTRGVVNAGL